ncbi:beta-L-arabinofuranosidase domain-containing protein [Alteribacillus sp. HJP-4]|uniref:beta-L-arabinofuranosidase domain-containing protein n=1 Tax=Alteribacillus sp. HJP-4 TaxID=2775394 RepID=UPI0035CD3122
METIHHQQASRVKLLEGLFKESQETGKGYILSLDIDRLAAPCYEANLQPPKKARYGGWEATAIAGHSIGHWLSAASLMYEATGDYELKHKVIYAVDELKHIQHFDPDGYVSGFPRTCFDQVFTGDFEVERFRLAGSWVPWYSLHKIFAGLIDAYHCTGYEPAREVVVKLAAWAEKGLAKLSDHQFQRMLTCEHGGMNESMAEVYLLTGEKRFRTLAKRFCHQAVLDPLAAEVDELEGKHANTQIPKVIGAAKLYEITGEPYYQRAARFFWHQVTASRTYVIGGNSIREHFGPPEEEALGITTTETCNTYNMLKLTSHLFRWSPKAVYMDFYEKALYNHILASQDPDSGMKTYFVSTLPGHFKVYCSPENSFWCCTGTGLENPARYHQNIYYISGSRLYVNLFISSRLIMQDRGMVLEQETSFPNEETTTLYVKKATGSMLDICIREPYWTVGTVQILVNGAYHHAPNENGYLIISRRWKSGDRVEVNMPMNLHTYRAKDQESKKAFMYGPIVLAGALGTENFPATDILEDHQQLNYHERVEAPVLVTNKEEVEQEIQQVSSNPLLFETKAIAMPGSQKIKLIPFYKLHHQRYTLYWECMNEADYREYRSRAEKSEVKTVDTVYPNEQQPEIDHHLKACNSISGYLHQVHSGWRECRGDGSFSYDMAVDPATENILLVTYYGSDGPLEADGTRYEREFDIAVGDKVVAREILQGEQPEELFQKAYDVPAALTNGRTKVTVTFTSQAGRAAGRVFGLSVITKRQR